MYIFLRGHPWDFTQLAIQKAPHSLSGDIIPSPQCLTLQPLNSPISHSLRSLTPMGCSCSPPSHFLTPTCTCSPEKQNKRGVCVMPPGHRDLSPLSRLPKGKLWAPPKSSTCRKGEGQLFKMPTHSHPKSFNRTAPKFVQLTCLASEKYTSE